MFLVLLSIHPFTLAVFSLHVSVVLGHHQARISNIKRCDDSSWNYHNVC